MRALLDTHVLLWVLGDSSRLDAASRALIEASESEVLFSAASILEIAIKARLGRSDFTVQPAEVTRAALNMGFVELPVRSDAAALVGELPLLHRDPIDRLLVAQAIAEPAILYTADRRLAPYSELVRLLAAR